MHVKNICILPSAKLLESAIWRGTSISARLSKLRIGHFQEHTDWIFTQYIILPFANKSKPSGEKNIKRDWLIRLVGIFQAVIASVLGQPKLEPTACSGILATQCLCVFGYLVSKAPETYLGNVAWAAFRDFAHFK